MGMMGEAILLSSAADAPRPDAAERLGRLFDSDHDRLYRLAHRMTGSIESARDAVQDTFLRAARSRHLVPDESPHEEAWLVRVLVNICRDEWRKREVRRRVMLDLVVVSEGGTEGALIAKAVVQPALQAVLRRRRAILVMYRIIRESGAPPVTALNMTKISDSARLEHSRQLYDAMRERDETEVQMRSVKQKFDVGLATGPEMEAAAVRSRRAEQRVQELQRLAGGTRGRGAAGQHIIDSTFAIGLGETVVVGTSRLNGDRALIAILTAAAKPAPAR